MTLPKKSAPEDIRNRFDQDVDGDPDLLIDLAAIPDSAVMMEITSCAAAALNPEALNVLEIGCGTGEGALNLLQKMPGLQFTFIDSSLPRLQKAEERLKQAGAGGVATLLGDIRHVPVAEDQFDIVIATAVMHHLTSESEWNLVLEKIYRAMKPGGSVWVVDLVAHNQLEVQQAVWNQYGEYLSELKDEAYRDEVFAYVEKEASMLPLNVQLRYLQQSGFSTEVLHKRMCFAAFGGVKFW